MPGDPWTADYLKITGELDVDLRSNIAGVCYSIGAGMPRTMIGFGNAGGL